MTIGKTIKQQKEGSTSEEVLREKCHNYRSKNNNFHFLLMKNKKAELCTLKIYSKTTNNR